MKLLVLKLSSGKDIWINAEQIRAFGHYDNYGEVGSWINLGGEDFIVAGEPDLIARAIHFEFNPS